MSAATQPEPNLTPLSFNSTTLICFFRIRYPRARLASNNDLDSKVCLSEPSGSLLEFEVSSAVREIAGVDEYVAFGKLEAGGWTVVVGVGDADYADLLFLRLSIFCRVHGS